MKNIIGAAHHGNRTASYFHTGIYLKFVDDVVVVVVVVDVRTYTRRKAHAEQAERIAVLRAILLPSVRPPFVRKADSSE